MNLLRADGGICPSYSLQNVCQGILPSHPAADVPTCSLLLFINRTSISKSCTDRPVAVDFKWAGLQAALLLDRAEWVVPLYWLLPTSKIPLLPWLQGELPKSVSVHLVALMELLASLVLSRRKKNPPSSPPRRQGCSGAALRSLATDACK